MEAKVNHLQSLLIKNKLRIPHAHTIVKRERLIQKLNRGEQKKLTLISAPAGFGKTTLLIEWAHQIKLPVAWFSLDDDDDNPIRFWTYVLSAINASLPPLGEYSLQLLKESQVPNFELILTLLINEIEDKNDTFVIVLDDYHFIQSQDIHTSLTFLLDHLPTQIRLIISTRVDPPLPIARLRVRNELTEIRAADLRFDIPETADFLNEIMQLKLTEENLRALNAKTEGWAAGLQIAALSIRGEPDVSGFIDVFKDSRRYIGDYLSEEVINRQPADIQSFLLHTSLLDQLNGDLCNAVTRRTDSHLILEQLCRDNLFITRLEEHSWYRFHQLFANSLRQRLAQEQPGFVPVLIRRAAKWYEENGDIAYAIKLYLSIKDYNQAAALIDRIAFEKINFGEVNQPLDWIGKLPEDVLVKWPMLIVYHAMALIASSLQLEVAGERLKLVESFLERDETQESNESRDSLAQISPQKVNFLRGSINAIHSYNARLKGDNNTAIPYAQKALKLLPEGEHLMRAWACWTLAEAFRYTGNNDQWAKALSDAISICQLTRNPGMILLTIDNLAELHASRGELHLAEKTWQKLLIQTKEMVGRKEFPISCTIHAGLGWLYFEWNNFELAVEQLIRAIELAKLGKMAEVTLEANITLARLKFTQGDIEGAIEIIENLEPVIRMHTENRHAIRARAYQAYWEFKCGNRLFFNKWLEARNLSQGNILDFHHESEFFIWIRTLILDGRFQEALSLLNPLQRAAQQSGRVGSELKALVLQAVALDGMENPSQALISLDRALALAEPGGYIRTFIDTGSNIGQLLNRYNLRGEPRAYVNRILSELALPPQSRNRIQSITEPLSDRELEVLRLIAARLSCREIADILQISVNTSRTHVRNIYSKLHVHGQAEAAVRARELGLIQ